MKACTKCGATKDRTEFHAHARSADGLQSWCKACRSAHAKATHDSDKAKAYRTEHQAEIRARKQAYLQANRGKEKERIERWARANPDKARAIKRRHSAKHGPRDLQRLERWAQENPGQVKEARRLREKADRDAAGPSYAAKVLRMKKTLAGPELLAAKGDQLTVRRLARTLRKSSHECITDPDRITRQPCGSDHEG